MIEAVNLCKQFERSTKRGKKMIKEEFLAVDNVSLQAREGEIVGIKPQDEEQSVFGGRAGRWEDGGDRGAGGSDSGRHCSGWDEG